jgi:DNA polymerase-3 subunit beta
MKLTITQPDLLTVLTKSVGVVERKNTIPVLSNVKLQAAMALTVTASDMDIEVMATGRADVTAPGSTTVNADTLTSIVKKLGKSAMVTLELADSWLTVSAGRSNFKLATLPAEDFPDMASSEYDHSGTIHADTLSQMLNKTKFAMSTEETRFMLNGVYMHNDDAGDLITVATDGHRLAKMTSEVDLTVAPVIIPRKTVLELVKLLDDADDVTVETSETKLRVSGDGFTITSKVVDGTFPQYERVIPTRNDKPMTVCAKEFSDASARVSLVSDDRTRAVKLNVSDGACVLSVRGSGGNAVEEVAVEYSSADLEAGYNSKYLAEMMAQAEGGNVEMTFGSPMDPALVKLSEVEGFVGVTMPMRI